ncbi:MAG TPA: LysR family transcriptional regulator [Verrucomicrobiae bacterium]|jgi:DNA-binding transcriptional LysR family regulator|nr:LysR family transcriptional regulator [Verrucomicrobiae bacterium]
MDEPLDSRQLRAFVVLAETGSYTETARRLFVTHSAISHAMRALESTVGCRLLNNLNKKVMLTDAGEALLQHAQQVLEEMRRAKTNLNALNKWGSRRLRISAEAPLAGYFLNDVLVEFHHKFPNVMVSVELHNRCDAYAFLTANRTDLVFAEKPPVDGRFEFCPLFSDTFHVVMGPQHPWAVKKSVTLSEFPKAPFILHRNLARSQKMLADYLEKSGFQLNTVAEMDSLDSIKDFVRQTRAISILPTWAIECELRDGILVALPLGRRSFEQTWGFTRWTERALTHSESGFVHICRTVLMETAAKIKLKSTTFPTMQA